MSKLLFLAEDVAYNVELFSQNATDEKFHIGTFLLTDISNEKWEQILARNNLNIMELRDSRYNQIVHMVSAANGAEEFYSIEVRLNRYSLLSSCLLH